MVGGNINGANANGLFSRDSRNASARCDRRSRLRTLLRLRGRQRHVHVSPARRERAAPDHSQTEDDETMTTRGDSVTLFALFAQLEECMHSVRAPRL